jgi:hypothetical protein
MGNMTGKSPLPPFAKGGNKSRVQAQLGRVVAFPSATWERVKKSEKGKGVGIGKEIDRYTVTVLTWVQKERTLLPGGKGWRRLALPPYGLIIVGLRIRYGVTDCRKSGKN